MDEGVETKRRCYHIYADKVPERVLNRGRYRLNCMLEHDPKGIKAGEKLESSEDHLIQAVIDYIEKGANEELVMRAVELGIKWGKESAQK